MLNGEDQRRLAESIGRCLGGYGMTVQEAKEEAEKWLERGYAITSIRLREAMFAIPKGQRSRVERLLRGLLALRLGERPLRADLFDDEEGLTSVRAEITTQLKKRVEALAERHGYNIQHLVALGLEAILTEYAGE